MIFNTMVVILLIPDIGNNYAVSLFINNHKM